MAEVARDSRTHNANTRIQDWGENLSWTGTG